MWSKYPERSAFPFLLFRSTGWMLVILALISCILGISDTAYTANNFDSDDCDSNDYGEWREDPCKNDKHVYTYISAAIWGSIMVLITGLIGAMSGYWNPNNIRFQRDLYGLMAGITCIMFIPVIIIMHSLELKYGKDMGVFYYDDDTLKTRDEVKFALPLVILIVCGAEWIICLVVTFTSCCCAYVDEFDEDPVYRGRREPSANPGWWNGCWPYQGRPWVYEPQHVRKPVPIAYAVPQPIPQPIPQPMPVPQHLPNYSVYATPIMYPNC